MDLGELCQNLFVIFFHLTKMYPRLPVNKGNKSLRFMDNLQ